MRIEATTVSLSIIAENQIEQVYLNQFFERFEKQDIKRYHREDDYIEFCTLKSDKEEEQREKNEPCKS